jgi:uncharacterized delta-60 repeat protein
VQSDGKILLGGLFSMVNGVSRNGIARLNADGTLDPTFAPEPGTRDGAGSVGSVNAVVVQSDGKILLAGNYTSLNGQPVPSLGRLNADGSLDLGFNSGVGVCVFCEPPEIRGLGVLSDGIVMVGGLFDRVDALFIKGVARLQSNGSVDFNFVPPIANEEEVRAIAVGADGKTTAAITVIGAEGNQTRFLRFNPDGAIDTSFQPENVVGEDATAIPVTALQVDSAGRLLLAGRFQRVGNTPKRGLARLNVDGSLDSSLDIGAGFGNGIFPPPRNISLLITALAVQPNGGVLAGGNFGTVDEQVRIGLARFQPGGTNPPPPPTGDAPRLHGVARAANGVVTMLLSGEAGQNYRIEGSADLRTWTALGTVTGGAAPQTFTDANAATFPQRFYRAVR